VVEKTFQDLRQEEEDRLAVVVEADHLREVEDCFHTQLRCHCENHPIHREQLVEAGADRTVVVVVVVPFPLVAAVASYLVVGTGYGVAVDLEVVAVDHRMVEERHCSCRNLHCTWNSSWPW